MYCRLNWPSRGILEGEIPKTKQEFCDTKTEYMEDDGEFVYCVPRNNDLGGRYNPYDLVQITPKKVVSYSTYYTISASYVSKVY